MHTRRFVIRSETKYNHQKPLNHTKLQMFVMHLVSVFLCLVSRVGFSGFPPSRIIGVDQHMQFSARFIPERNPFPRSVDCGEAADTNAPQSQILSFFCSIFHVPLNSKNKW